MATILGHHGGQTDLPQVSTRRGLDRSMSEYSTMSNKLTKQERAILFWLYIGAMLGIAVIVLITCLL
jgi:hypothetical protein